MKRFLGTVMAAAGLALGGTLLFGRGSIPDPSRSGADVLRLTGPLRGLPVPFLWVAWGEARHGHDPHAAAVASQWLARLLPERLDLFLGFAWELAYDAAAVETAPTRQAQLLLDAVRFLEEGMQIHTGAYVLPATAAFLLIDRCDGSPEKAARRRAFEAAYGLDPLQLAGDFDASAQVLAPEIEFFRWRRGLTEQIRAIDAILGGDLMSAARGFGRASDFVQGSDPDRARRLRQLAGQLPSGIENLTPELLQWLRRDHLLGRNPGMWAPR